MGRGVRVKFEPEIGPASGGAASVPGGTITLVEFGSGTTAAERDAPKPARLVFHGAYLDRARKVSLPEFARIATLSGKIERRGTPPRAVFLFEPEAELVYDEPEPENGEPFRELRLTYDLSRFDSIPDDADGPTRIRLPLEPDDARFFELTVELGIDGKKEASVANEHRLDVPLPPRPGPIFEWSEELTDELPVGLTLILEEDGKRMALDWQQGEVVGAFRRFAFARLTGTKPCTLVAQVGKKKLTLLDQQVISDPKRPIKWSHFIEEFRSLDRDEDDIVDFVGNVPDVPVGAGSGAPVQPVPRVVVDS